MGDSSLSTNNNNNNWGPCAWESALVERLAELLQHTIYLKIAFLIRFRNILHFSLGISNFTFPLQFPYDIMLTSGLNCFSGFMHHWETKTKLSLNKTTFWENIYIENPYKYKYILYGNICIDCSLIHKWNLPPKWRSSRWRRISHWLWCNPFS